MVATLRREQPVYRNPESDGAGFWAVLRHADIVQVSHRPDLFSSAHADGGHRISDENWVGLTGAGEAAIDIPFISIDPPIHAKYRKLLMPALAELLGLPAGDWPRLFARTNVFIGKDDLEFRQSPKATGDFFAFAQAPFEARRAGPGRPATSPPSSPMPRSMDSRCRCAISSAISS